jgi:hypothetical protein
VAAFLFEEGLMTTDDFWKPFSESEWRDFASTVSASELQLKFAVARFNGATATAAAKVAGYAGSHDELRRAGYSAVRSAAVVALLDLATAAAPAEKGLTDAEVDTRLAKLVRSPDPLIMLKATELYDKRKQRAKEAGQEIEDDVFAYDRYCREILEMRNGASIYMLMYKNLAGNLGWPGNYQLLHDVHFLMQREPFGRQIWDHMCVDCSDQSRQSLAKDLADPSYQLETRLKIWSEVGKKPPGPVLEKLSA